MAAATAPAPATPTKRPPRRTKEKLTWSSRLARWDIRWMPYVLISPFFVLFLVFGMFPLLYNVVVSFRRWRLDDPGGNGWVGVDNYVRVAGDDRFWAAMYNTIGILLVAAVPQILLALVLAFVLNRRLRFKTPLRMAILLPYITPLAATTFVFSVLFAREVGLINYVLDVLPLVEPVDFRTSRLTSWPALAVMINWRWIGYNALIYLAAMQSVPKDLYEASALDGASPWRQFWTITVPLIRPTIIFTVVLTTIGQMQLFTEPMLFDTNPSTASGGAAGQYQTAAMLIYQTAWKRFDLGYAAAMSVVVFLFIIGLSLLNAALTRRGVGGR